MIELLIALVEGVIAIIMVTIEGIIGLFTAAGEVLSVGEAVAVALIVIVELIIWLIYFLFELIAALFKWRKPKSVKKPVIWRPKKTIVDSNTNQPNEQ